MWAQRYGRPFAERSLNLLLRSEAIGRLHRPAICTEAQPLQVRSPSRFREGAAGPGQNFCGSSGVVPEGTLTQGGVGMKGVRSLSCAPDPERPATIIWMRLERDPSWDHTPRPLARSSRVPLLILGSTVRASIRRTQPQTLLAQRGDWTIGLVHGWETEAGGLTL